MATDLDTRSAQTGALEGERLREALRLILTIRHFDERALALYRAGEMRGPTHPYIGMEAVGVGVMVGVLVAVGVRGGVAVGGVGSVVKV